MAVEEIESGSMRNRVSPGVQPHFWELIRSMREWTEASPLISVMPPGVEQIDGKQPSVSVMPSEDERKAQLRWMRRQLRFLEAAGLVERRMVRHRTFFRSLVKDEVNASK